MFQRVLSCLTLLVCREQYVVVGHLLSVAMFLSVAVLESPQLAQALLHSSLLLASEFLDFLVELLTILAWDTVMLCSDLRNSEILRGAKRARPSRSRSNLATTNIVTNRRGS